MNIREIWIHSSVLLITLRRRKLVHFYVTFISPKRKPSVGNMQVAHIMRITWHKALPWHSLARWQGPMLPSPQSDQPWTTILIDSHAFLSHLTKVKWRKILTRATFASSMANLIPIQARGPWPKPKKVYLCRYNLKINFNVSKKTYGLLLAFASLLKLSGLKTVGLGK